MMAANPQDPREEFRAAIAALGWTPPDYIEPGKLYRFSTNGKRGDDAGWCKLFDDLRGGVFGCHRENSTHIWQAEHAVNSEETAEERARFRAEIEASRARREQLDAAKHARAAETAKTVYRLAQPVGEGHPYLARKKIAPAPSLREMDAAALAAAIGYTPRASGETLTGRIIIAPVGTKSGGIATLEFIDGEGRKSALAGGRKAGQWWNPTPITPGAETIAIAEGVATAITIREATGWQVMAALSCSNLATVARAAREIAPGAEIVICGDIGNGERDAREAAEDNDARFALPDFGDKRPQDGTDFNDLAYFHGIDAVRAQLVREQEPRAEFEPMPEFEQAPRPELRVVPIDRNVRERPPMRPVNLIGLANTEPQEPRFVMEGLPEGVASANFGHGGVGKSSIELTRAVCIAAGIEFCGLPVQRRRVAFFSCEDRENVLHWRLSRICGALGVNLASLDEWLNIFDLVGRDVAIYAPNSRGDFVRSPFGEISEAIAQTESDVLFFDGTSDFFGGNENDRGQVKQYVNLTNGLMRDATGAVMLIGHVGKEAARNPNLRDSYSGSTQWHNAIRSRWNSAPEVEGEGNERTGRLIVSSEKANYAAGGIITVWSWDEEHRAFVGRLDNGQSESVAYTIGNEQIRSAILRSMAAIYERGGYVPAAMQGQNTAINAVSGEADFPAALLRRGAANKLRKALDEMRRDGTIVEASFMRANRHRANALALPEQTTVVNGLRQVIQGTADATSETE
jgi:phage/plasmid primase-like uncharacterized protein